MALNLRVLTSLKPVGQSFNSPLYLCSLWFSMVNYVAEILS
jgi:hypothetical protein